MQRGGGRRDDFGFGDPFGGFGGPGNLFSRAFGGRDPFEDPFFTQPFGSLMGPSMMGPSMLGPSMLGPSMMGPSMLGPSMMGPSMFGPSMFGPSMFGAERSFFGEPNNAGFLEQQAPPSLSKGPIIKELSSDDEEGDEHAKEKDNPKKHSRSSNEPYVEVPDEETEEKKSRRLQQNYGFSRAGMMPPQPHTYSFHSSTVTYGGPNGPYYTSSTTKRTGGNGLTLEESKEADTTTGKATHKIARGIRDKGHSVTRKLNSDGRVNTMQTLHNLNEDDLAGFEEAWKGNARQHLPGWNQGVDMLGNGGGSSSSSSSSSRREEPSTRRWALPSTEQPQGSGRMKSQSQARRA